MPVLTEIFKGDFVLQFGGRTLGCSWGSASNDYGLDVIIVKVFFLLDF